MTLNLSQDTPKISDAAMLEKRYVAAYQVADAKERTGNNYRILAVLLGILTIFLALSALIFTQSLLAAVSFSFPGLLFTAYMHSAGVHISTQAQLLRINIDSAINTSPFLNNEQKVAIMDLDSELLSEEIIEQEIAQDSVPLILTGREVEEVADDAEINLRLFVTDELPLTLSLLATNLQQVNPAYAIDDISTRLVEAGLFKVDTEVLGQLEIKRYGKRNFDNDLAEFAEVMQTTKRSNSQPVIDVLENTKVIVMLTLPPGSRENAAIQEKVEPLWEWLFANRTGLLHIDDEGFYRGMELIFQLD